MQPSELGFSPDREDDQYLKSMRELHLFHWRQASLDELVGDCRIVLQQFRIDQESGSLGTGSSTHWSYINLRDIIQQRGFVSKLPQDLRDFFRIK